MATRKFIHSGRKNVRSGLDTDRHLDRAAPSRVRRNARVSVKRTSTSSALADDLAAIAFRLKIVYGTTLATEFALRKQDAEQDVDLALCLRANVCEPIALLREQIQLIVKRLGGDVPALLP
jgi:hypothetical protein